ncbi:glycosyl transferase family 1 [Haloactinopolyspora alba]|uniref:Glycosyl transferase family 1 n=1 Tax=Haloactinopolyspora alba TaxID=648780 RepID=A0A2P8E0V5_9ACTN|nr:glycosyltransferase family 4 protein [Haloactinopolyspora alba]PSL03103.1 glycosyl transferase family 1 [Haloactinopolyspora alba]
MDILVVTVVHDPEDARIRHRQIRALLDAGHRVTYAAPFTAYQRPVPDDVATVELPRARGKRRLAAARAARRLLRTRGRSFDVTLLHDPELVVAAAGLRVPGLVWDVHEDTAAAVEMKTWLPSALRPAAARLIRVAEHYAERRMPLLLAEDSYTERFRDPHPIVHNSVLVPDSAAPAASPEPRVVYLGRLTRPRGALELVELGRRLAPDITVEVIGPADADCRDPLAAAHDEGVLRWHGFLPNDDALAHLPGTLAGLSLLHDQPNYARSRPTKIIEYMAHGVPVITTPNPSSAELVDRYGCGLVVPFGDVAAAESRIRALARDVESYHRYSAAGRAAALENYSWSAEADTFVRTLEEFAAHAVR